LRGQSLTGEFSHKWQSQGTRVYLHYYFSWLLISMWFNMYYFR